jgi:hypothetical protein
MGTEENYYWHIGQVVNKCKPQQGTYYFGLLLGNSTVLSVFKSSKFMDVRA